MVDLDVPPSEAVPGLGDAATLDAVLRAADLLKPAKAAARELVPGAGADPLAMARALRARFGCGAVVVTDGEAGCAIAAQGFEGFVPARAVKAVDTTGAGDAFLGGLLVALHHGLGWEAAGRLANACGAACVEKLGAFPDDPARARARVLELYDGPPLALAACARRRRRARRVAGARHARRRARRARGAARVASTAGAFEAALATDPRGRGGRRARARDRGRQARARRALRGVAALVDGHARHVPARDRGRARERRPDRRGRRRDRDQQQRRDGGAAAGGRRDPAHGRAR